MFKRNKKFDELIAKIKLDKSVLKQLDYEQLELFVNYLVNLNKHLKGNKGE